MPRKQPTIQMAVMPPRKSYLEPISMTHESINDLGTMRDLCNRINKRIRYFDPGRQMPSRSDLYAIWNMAKSLAHIAVSRAKEAEDETAEET